LQEVPERNSQKEGLQNLNLAEIAEQCRPTLHLHHNAEGEKKRRILRETLGCATRE
jgi:hypothetical protein